MPSERAVFDAGRGGRFQTSFLSSRSPALKSVWHMHTLHGRLCPILSHSCLSAFSFRSCARETWYGNLASLQMVSSRYIFHRLRAHTVSVPDCNAQSFIHVTHANLFQLFEGSEIKKEIRGDVADQPSIVGEVYLFYYVNASSGLFSPFLQKRTV